MPRIIIHPDGRREVAEEATDVPQVGAMPRHADGTPIGTDGLPMETPPAQPRQRTRRPAARATPAPAEPPQAEPEAPPTPATEA